MTCFAADSIVLDLDPAWSSWRAKCSLCPQGSACRRRKFLLAGFLETVCEISVSFPTSLNVPSSLRYLSTTHRRSEQPARYLASYISALFGFLRLNGAHGELLMRQLPWGRRLEVGHHCYLLHSHYPSSVKDRKKCGRVAPGELGYKCHMQLDWPCPTPHRENIL